VTGSRRLVATSSEAPWDSLLARLPPPQVSRGYDGAAAGADAFRERRAADFR